MKEESLVYRRRWWTFASLGTSILIVVIDHTILNVALPTLQREFGATFSELQWMVDAYILVFAALLLTMGALGDRIGRATTLRIGLLVFGLASLWAVLAPSSIHLIWARALMGFGAAMIIPATLAIIANVFPREERGKAIGVWGAMNGLGVALGPLLGGLLIENFSWSAIFVINIPIVLIAIASGWFLVPNSRDPYPKGLDIPGTILSTCGLSVLVFGLIKASDWGWAHPTVLGIIIGSVFIGILFILWELRTANPMVDLSLFRNKRLSTGVGSIGMMAISMFGILFGLTLYMQFVKGYSALDTGLRLLPMAFGYALGSMMANRTVAHFGTTRVITAGFFGLAICSVVIAFWQTSTPYWQIGLVLFAVSFSLGNIMAPSLESILGAVPEKQAGVGSALNTVSLQVGAALGVAALGSVLSSVYAATVAPDIAQLSNLPPEVASTASESVGAAVIAAGQLPADVGNNLVQIARSGFIAGWQVLSWIICGIGVIGAGFALKFMPPRHLPREGVEGAVTESTGIPVLQGAFEAIPVDRMELSAGQEMGDADDCQDSSERF